MRVLICGGGVIAYFLSLRGIAAIVVERTGLACAASGKAGRFLARDWCDGTPLESLARRSFALHAQLPQQIGGDWGYRRLDTFGGVADAHCRGDMRSRAWLSDRVAIGRRLGVPQTTAQVHPAGFTAALMQAAAEQGAELRRGRVTGILRRGERAAGVAVDGEAVAGDAVVVALGPWSILAAHWLPLPAVFGLKGHSLIFATGKQVPAEAVFLEYREPSGIWQSPELFPRPDGTIYVCAVSSDSPFPFDPGRLPPLDLARLRPLAGEGA